MALFRPPKGAVGDERECVDTLAVADGLPRPVDYATMTAE